MIQTLCDHGAAVIPILLAAIAAVGGLNLWWIRRYIGKEDQWKEKNEKRQDAILAKLELALAAHDMCQKVLPEKYATRPDVALIGLKIDKITDLISNFHSVYRTKEEASREWHMLEARLSAIEGSVRDLAEGNAERYKGIIEQLNRVVG